MKLLYTPGPWSYEVSFDPVSTENRLNLIGDGKIIAQHMKMVEHPEAEGNSQLIAAAPSLLAACERVLIEYLNTKTPGAPSLQTLSLVAEAVTKAKGGL